MLERIRMCVLGALHNDVPFCCGLSRKDYYQYFDSEIMYALPWDYIGIVECHEDWYYHCTRDLQLAEQIVNEGILRVDKSRENNSCGKGVYTFPRACGRVADAFGSHVIRFKCNQKHVHIVNVADNTIKPLGECVFFENVHLQDATIITTSEAQLESNECYREHPGVMQHYYGVDIEKPELEFLPDILEDVVINKVSSWVEEERKCGDLGTESMNLF